MNHKDFTRVVQEALGGTATERAAELAINAVTRALTDGLAEEGEVRLAGFGNFRLRRYANRPYPGTSDTKATSNWMRLTFTPSRNIVLPAREDDKERLPRTCPADSPYTPA